MWSYLLNEVVDVVPWYALYVLQTGKTKEAPIARKSLRNLGRKQKWKFFIPTNLRDFSLKRSGLTRTKCYQKQG